MSVATPVDFSKLKVVDLRQELTNRGLDSKGNKQELVTRLLAATSGGDAGTVAPTTPTTITPTTTLAAAPAAPVTTSTSPATPAAAQAKGKKPAAAKAKPAPSPTTTVAPETTTPVTITETPATIPIATTPAPIIPEAPATEEAQGAEEEVDITQLSEVERKQKRAERFGIPVNVTEGDKKKMRVERFGDVSGGVGNDKKSKVNLKPNSAASRLGLPVKEQSQVSDEKFQARQAKFGGASASPATAGPKKPNVVFSAEDEEKRRKRAERFAVPATTSV